IIGDGELKDKLIRLVKEYDVNVNFIGNVPNDKIPQILNKYEYFILPSYWEGNPKVLLEAMSCGLVCIAADVWGIRNIIQHKINGYLCKNDANSIKNAILILEKDQGLREKIKHNAREYVVKNCSFLKIIEKEYNAYKEVIQNKKN
ncbi:MAG: glycosyltransferase, partial [Promethearchaeia archaeon]